MNINPKHRAVALCSCPSWAEHHGSQSAEGECCHAFDELLEAVKKQVLVIDIADLLCGPAGNRSGWLKSGRLWVARCPLPRHEFEWSFSFAVSKEENYWYCCECRLGGNVLDLYALAGGYADKAKALMGLAHERWV